MNPQKITLFLANLFLEKNLLITPGAISSFITKEGLIKFQNISNENNACIDNDDNHQIITDGLLGLLNQGCDWESEVNNLSQTHLDSKMNGNYSHLALVSAALTIIPHVVCPFTKTFNALLTFVKTLFQFLRSVDSKSVKLHQERPLTVGFSHVLIINLIGQAIDTLTKICRVNSTSKNEENLVEIWNLVIDEVLIAHSDNHVILKGVTEYLDYVRSR